MRCLASIAAALGCVPEALPRDVRRAVVVHGHECYQVALSSQMDQEERTTQPAPSRDVPTRVDRHRSRAR